MRNNYFTINYLSLPRWNSLWHQINEVVSLNPKKVLEIGVGSGINAFVIKQFGIQVITLDNDKKLSPDVVGDLRKIPLKDEAVDLVTCFQVLEHISFADVPKALKEIFRVSLRHAIISVPEPYNSYFELRLKLLPFLPRLDFIQKVTWLPGLLKKLPQSGPHQWELGRPGFERDHFDELIKKTGFKIIKSFYSAENLYHRFYVLEKKS